MLIHFLVLGAKCLTCAIYERRDLHCIIVSVESGNFGLAPSRKWNGRRVLWGKLLKPWQNEGRSQTKTLFQVPELATTSPTRCPPQHETVGGHFNLSHSILPWPPEGSHPAHYAKCISLSLRVTKCLTVIAFLKDHLQILL